MTRQSKKKPVGNVSKASKPKNTKPAEGVTVYTSGGINWAIPAITTKLVEQYAENALLAEPVSNLKNLIFRGAAQVTVYDKDGETDNDLSEQAKKIYEDCDLHAAHQTAFTDIIYGGCSVFSYGWDEELKRVVFRNLPWNSFRELPAGFVDVYNPVMPGIVIDKSTNKVRAFQTPDDRSMPKEIHNFSIIKDPTSPNPSGKPDCLPIIPLITNYNFGQKAWQQKMNRIAAPPIFPYVEKITASNKAYMESIAQKWGKDTCFLMEGTMDFKDPKLKESTTAEEFLAWHKKRIDGYFNPATFLQKEGNSIGGSDSGGMELIYNHIDKTLSMLESQINKVTIKKWLDDDGYTDKGYRAEIKHPRPSVKKDAQILAEVAELAKNGAITINEMRQALPNTDLGELTPEEEAALQAQVKGRQAQSNPFGGFGQPTTGAPQPTEAAPVGNILSPVERTDVISDTERELIRATWQCATDVKRIVREQIRSTNP